MPYSEVRRNVDKRKIQALFVTAVIAAVILGVRAPTLVDSLPAPSNFTLKNPIVLGIIALIGFLWWRSKKNA